MCAPSDRSDIAAIGTPTRLNAPGAIRMAANTRDTGVITRWIVVAQRPEVGTPIGEGDAVLSAVKLDEPNNC